MVHSAMLKLFVRSGSPFSIQIILLVILLLITILSALVAGRYPIAFDTVVMILIENIWDIGIEWKIVDERVVELVRMPRIIVAASVGAALSVCGVVLQGMFRNPLVGPQIIGVSSGAAFGGALSILLLLPDFFIPILASVFGTLAILCTLLIARSGHKTHILSLVLGGVVTSGFFTALLSLAKYGADPDDVLPAIVYWLMGSFNDSGYLDVIYIVIPLLIIIPLIYRMRYTINILSLGDEEAQTLGINVRQARWVLLGFTAALVAASVSVSGVVGWVGLVIPHFARMICGPDHAKLIPISALVGAIYLVIVDTVARTASQGEIPIGVLTALLGAPVFAVLLRKTQSKGWSRD